MWARRVALAWATAILSASIAHASRQGVCETARTDDATAPYLAVVSAYPAELAPIVAATEIDATIEIGGRPFYTGRLAGVRVLLGLTGIGVVNAENVTRSLLARRGIAGLVMSGTGGTRHHIGDVVVASELVEPGRTRVYRPNAALLALAGRAATALPEPLERCTLVPPGSPSAETVCLLFDPTVIIGGHLVSIDPFDGAAPPCSPGGGEIFGCELPASAPLSRSTRSITTDDVEDMESAAVARVAAKRGVPFLAVRAGSDGGGDPLGDRGFPAQFFDYYRLAAHNAADLTRAVVAELARLASDDTARRTCRLLARARWKAAASRIAAQ
jgi:adenosylhomocysteine nucleosidase